MPQHPFRLIQSSQGVDYIHPEDRVKHKVNWLPQSALATCTTIPDGVDMEAVDKSAFRAALAGLAAIRDWADTRPWVRARLATEEGIADAASFCVQGLSPQARLLLHEYTTGVDEHVTEVLPGVDEFATRTFPGVDEFVARLPLWTDAAKGWAVYIKVGIPKPGSGLPILWYIGSATGKDGSSGRKVSHRQEMENESAPERDVFFRHWRDHSDSYDIAYLPWWELKSWDMRGKTEEEVKGKRRDTVLLEATWMQVLGAHSRLESSTVWEMPSELQPCNKTCPLGLFWDSALTKEEKAEKAAAREEARQRALEEEELRELEWEEYQKRWAHDKAQAEAEAAAEKAAAENAAKRAAEKAAAEKAAAENAAKRAAEKAAAEKASPEKAARAEKAAAEKAARAEKAAAEKAAAAAAKKAASEASSKRPPLGDVSNRPTKRATRDEMLRRMGL